VNRAVSTDRDNLEHQLRAAWSGAGAITEADAYYFLSEEFPGLATRIAGKNVGELNLLELDAGQQLFPLEIARPRLQVFLLGAIAISLLRRQEVSSKRDRLENVFFVIYQKHRDLLSPSQADAIQRFLRYERAGQGSSLGELAG
jgi:hypothetical protein